MAATRLCGHVERSALTRPPAHALLLSTWPVQKRCVRADAGYLPRTNNLTVGAPKRRRPGFDGFTLGEEGRGGRSVPWLLMELDQKKPDSYYDDWPEPEEKMDEPKFVNGKRVLINKQIEARSVRLLGMEREELGVVPTSEARAIAKEEDVDLVLINDNQDPPIARLIDFSKFKYEAERAVKDKQKAAKTVEVKEVRMRPVTEPHDYQVKLKSAQKFLVKGAKVKLSMSFAGRQLRFKDQGRELMLKFVEDLAEFAVVDGAVNFKAAAYTVMLNPKK